MDNRIITAEDQNDKQSANRLNDLGVLCHKSGRKKEALTLYKIAIMKDPINYLPHFNLGNLLTEIGEYTRAAFFLERALMCSADNIDIYSNLAFVYRRCKRYDKAIASYERLLELDEDNETACFFLAALNGLVPQRAPAAYVASLFDNYAQDFDEHLTKALRYQTALIKL